MSGNSNFDDMFSQFSLFGDNRSTGTLISLSQSDKWMKQAKIFNTFKRLTTTDTAITFKKLKSLKLNLDQYVHFLQDLCSYCGIDINEIMEKMSNCDSPFPAQKKTADVVARLTDTSKYTGAHKQRFDQTGRGKGIEGREYLTDETGYVTGYENMGTYDDNVNNN